MERSFFINCLTQFFSSPRALHWETAIHCLSYLFLTTTFGIVFGLDHEGSLTAYSDSDWAGNPITRRSGGGFIYNRIRIHCDGTYHQTITLPTTNHHRSWISRNHEFNNIVGDNQLASSSVGNKSSKSRIKHIDVRLKFCGVVKKGVLQIRYISSKVQNIYWASVLCKSTNNWRRWNELYLCNCVFILAEHLYHCMTTKL